MTQRARKFGTVLVGAIVALTLSLPAFAQQNPFQTAITVNDLVITNYELAQRERFLTLLRAPGNPAEEAREGLIEDRLRLTATRAAGIAPSEDEILGGMEEFAGRANLSAEQFITEIERAGVAGESFRDFVTAGLAWRQLIQGRFGPRAQISEAELDRALAQSANQTTVRVLLSEIILPLAPPVAERNRALVRRLSDTITTEGAFASAARQYSAAPTRGRGGRLEWLPITRVPPILRAQVLTLAPGEVTEPIELGPGVGIFQLRALEEIEGEAAETTALEYVKILIPGGNTQAAQAQAQRYNDDYDTCDDLYKPAQGLDADQFERIILPAGQVPGDIALELAKLDQNENSSVLTQQNGAFLVYLKLCGRTLALEEEELPPVAPDEELAEGEIEEAAPLPVDRRAQVRNQLFQQRLASFGDAYLEELRADAIIVER